MDRRRAGSTGGPGGGPMLSADLRLTNPSGLHLRPATVLVRTAARFRSDVRLSVSGSAAEPADAKSILAVLTLGVEPGARIRISAEGADEAEALAALIAAVEGGLGEQPEEAPRLTRREREILVLLTAGLTRKQIARQLGLAEPTVRNHLTRLYRRLGVQDARQAVVRAFRTNLLDR